MLILEEVVAKKPEDLNADEVAFLKENADKLSDEQKETFAGVLEDGDGGEGAGEGEGTGEGVSEADVKALVDASMKDIIAQNVDKIATQIAQKFARGVVNQRKRAIDTGVRSTETKKTGDATRNFLKALFDQDHAALRQISKAAGYLDTGTSASAGYLIPTELMTEVLRIAEKQYGVARREFRYMPFSGAGKSRTIPTLGSSVQVFWTEEAEAKTSTKPTVGVVTQTLKKLAAIVPMTDELLEDSAVNLTQLIAELFAEAVAKEEDAQFFAGTGSPWTGIINNGSVNGVTMESDDIDDLTADDLLSMVDATPTGALSGAKFYLSRTVLSKIRKLKDGTSGQYVFSRPGEGFPGTIWDYPYVVVDSLPAVSDVSAGDPFVIFGNLKQAAIFGDKQQLRVKLLDQAVVGSAYDDSDINLATQDMSAIRVVERVGYVLALPQAVSVLSTNPSS